VHEPGFDRVFDRVLIHPRHHQYPLGSGILDDRWNETVGIVFELLHAAPTDLVKMKGSKD
jgi:hypothetical protein